MKIYELRVAASCPRLEVVDRSLGHIKKLKKVNPGLCPDWIPPELKRYENQTAETGDYCDLTFIGTTTAFALLSGRMKETLIDFCGISEQWLDVLFPDKAYTLLHVTRVLDALDEDQSSIRRVPNSRVVSLDKLVFKPAVVDREWVFRLSTKPYSIFYTDQFAELISQQGWTGISIRPVWDSELEPFSLRPNKQEINDRPDVFGPDGIVTGYEEAWPADQGDA